MSTNDKFVIQTNGHLKRIPTTGLANGSYGFTLTDGAISVGAVETEVTPSSFKNTSGSVLNPTTPFVPVAFNRNGFVKLLMPSAANDLSGIVNTGSGEYQSKSITGVNVITNQYKLSAPTIPSFYYYDNAASAWKAIHCNKGGSYYLQHDSTGIKCAALNAQTLYQHCFALGTSPNIIMQYNKGTIHNVEVPSTAGNYNLNVDAQGNVSFSQGQVAQRLTVSYNLSTKSGATTPTIGSDGLMLALSQDGAVQADSTFKLKASTKFYVDFKFSCYIPDTSVYDSQTKAGKVMLKIGGSDASNLVDSQYVLHPECGILELRFTGLVTVNSETPTMFIELDDTLKAITTLSFADSTNLGKLTFIEV